MLRAVKACQPPDTNRSPLRRSCKVLQTLFFHHLHGSPRKINPGAFPTYHWSSSDHSTIFAYLALSFIFSSTSQGPGELPASDNASHYLQGYLKRLGCWFAATGMNKVPVTALAASVYKSGFFQFCNQFPDF
jgi:hypothetical protein